ncbi:MAG: tyrosine-type recombinase/integrase [Candidatus Eisenbacteria bacterium]|nr:tyrosine-type recombinase/integrase [Candidatus Eisenbacteria bacterium]
MLDAHPLLHAFGIEAQVAFAGQDLTDQLGVTAHRFALPSGDEECSCATERQGDSEQAPAWCGQQTELTSACLPSLVLHRRHSMSRLSPQTLTATEQQALLQATRRHPRDHLIVSLALGTGLRLGELVGLNVGDLYFPTGEPRARVRVRPEIAKRGRTGDVFLPDALVPKVRRFWTYKRRRAERLDPSAPLLCGLSRRRISRRRVQVVVRAWQLKAGFDRLYPFHVMRHTSVTNVYRASRDLFLAQRFARHASPLTTVIYTHPSDEELRQQLRHLVC